MTLRVVLIQGGGAGFDQAPAVQQILAAAGACVCAFVVLFSVADAAREHESTGRPESTTQRLPAFPGTRAMLFQPMKWTGSPPAWPMR